MTPPVLAALRQRREEAVAPAAPARLELLLAEAPALAAGDWAPAGGLPAALEEPLPAPRALRPRVPVELQQRRDDNWLARRVGRVLPDPFGVLFERNWRPLYAFCLTLVGGREEAEDAAQEALARAYAVLSARREEPDFRPWLFQIARNACIDRLRERGRRDVAGDALDEDSLGAGDAPGDVLERRQGMRALLADLGALSERQRAALVLRELSGMSHEEIAATLDTTPARTKSLVSEARQALGERRAGRDLGCEEYRRALATAGSRNPRGHRLVAHQEACARCRRGRRPALFSIFPFPVLAPAIDALRRLAGGGSAGGASGGGAAAAKLAVAGAAVALAVPVVQVAPGGEDGTTASRGPAAAGSQQDFSGGTASSRPSRAAAGDASRSASRARDARAATGDPAAPREARAWVAPDVEALLGARPDVGAPVLVRGRADEVVALAGALVGAVADELARIAREPAGALGRAVPGVGALVPGANAPRGSRPAPLAPAAPRRAPATGDRAPRAGAPAPSAPPAPEPAPPAANDLLDVPSTAERALDALGVGGRR